jgi:hypothetical protein
MRFATCGKQSLTSWKGSERMTTNMWLTVATMVLAIMITGANDYPALQVIMAGIIYVIIIAMVVMKFWM